MHSLQKSLFPFLIYTMKVILTLILIYKNLIFCNAKERIIGGTVANAGQYPFLAAIYKTTPDGSYFCAGSLYNGRWILTAGQCVEGAILFTIYLGTVNIKTPSNTSVKLAAEEYILHPEYNPLTLENDIGLIKTRMDVEYSDYISGITLTYFDVGDMVTHLKAIGWGQTDDDGQLSDDLHWVNLGSISNQECKITYGDQITDNMVCMVGNYNEGTCHGDTGSPLVVPYRTIYFHLGVSSFVSSEGCESVHPSGYTRTFPYIDWIKNVTSS